MRARLLPGGRKGARLEPEAGTVLLVPDRATAERAPRGAVLLLSGPRLPFVSDALDEVVDERAASPEALEEGARVVRAGGRLTFVTGARHRPGLAGVLGGLWAGRETVVGREEASAWLLGAGCEDLTQSVDREGLVVTQGRVRKLGPA